MRSCGLYITLAYPSMNDDSVRSTDHLTNIKSSLVTLESVRPQISRSSRMFASLLMEFTYDLASYFLRRVLLVWLFWAYSLHLRLAALRCIFRPFNASLWCLSSWSACPFILCITTPEDASSCRWYQPARYKERAINYSTDEMLQLPFATNKTASRSMSQSAGIMVLPTTPVGESTRERGISCENYGKDWAEKDRLCAWTQVSSFPIGRQNLHKYLSQSLFFPQAIDLPWKHQRSLYYNNIQQPWSFLVSSFSPFLACVVFSAVLLLSPAKSWLQPTRPSRSAA